MKQQKTIDITQGPILPALLRFYFPIVLGTFFQMLYNTADAIIVGQFVGKEALGAVGGSTGTLVSLFIGFFVGIGSGAAVVISQQFGAKNTIGVYRSVHTTFALALASGLFLTVFGVGCANLMSTLIGATGLLHKYCTQYLQVYFMGTIPVLVYNLGTGVLRAVGDSKRPLYYLVVCCVANIVLDLLLVGWLKMEVIGAALATVLSQSVSAILVVIALMRSTECFHLSLKEIRFHPHELKQICRIGLPAGLQSTMYGLSNVLIQTFINAFNTDVIAAWSAFTRIDTFFWMTLGALGTSMGTFIGQNFGAGNITRVRQCVRIGLKFGSLLAIVFSFLLYIFGYPLLSLFTKDVDVLNIGLTMMRFLTPFYITFVCIEIFSATLRGMGNTLLPTIMTCCGVCVFRIIWLIISKAVWPGVLLITISCYPLTWIITSTLFVIYYLYFMKHQGYFNRK